MPKDKSDRLDLLRACRANLSPIWGLSLARGWPPPTSPTGRPHAEAVDDDGVRHELWVLDEPGVVEEITRGRGGRAGRDRRRAPPLRDGPHLPGRATRAPRASAPGGYDLVMALVVELSEDQLSVGPIHRTISGVAARASTWPRCSAGGSTSCTPGRPTTSWSRRWPSPGPWPSSPADDVWLLTPREQTYAEAGSDLDSSLVALAIDAMPGADGRLRPRLAGGRRRRSPPGEADAAVLLRPVTVDQISDWAHARRRMPPKSTYFYPKPRTGMVFRTVED